MQFILLLSLFGFLVSPSAHALKLFNLNVFDQLQGKWDEGFREKRISKVADFISTEHPDVVVFEEARGVLPGEQLGGTDSIDAKLLRGYHYRKYIHEMTGADGASYGYWIGSRKKPKSWIEDGFSFPGGVARKVNAAVWEFSKKSCLGVLSLHLSYQTSAVRQLEARWILDWLKKHEEVCPRWLVVGDFNADEKSAEMKILFDGGLKSLFKELKPTVGAFNPIRRIYGENIPSLTIDWALAWNLDASAEVVLDSPWKGEWVSDHAGILIETK